MDLIKRCAVIGVIMTMMFLQLDATAATPSAKVRKHRVSVKVNKSMEKDAKTTSEEKESKNGAISTTQTKKETEVCTLDIRLKNPTDQEDTYQVECFFIGEKIDPKAEPSVIVFDKKVKKQTVAAKGVITIQSKSKMFVFEKSTKTIEGGSGNGANRNPKRTEEGTLFDGYVLVVKAGGNVLYRKANTPKFLSEKWSKKLRIPR